MKLPNSTRAFRKGTGILGAAEAGNHFAGAIVAAWLSLPFALVAYVAFPARYAAGVILVFIVLGFLVPRLFTRFLRVIGAIASIIPR